MKLIVEKPSTLTATRLFQTRTGRTVPQYANELRIARACRLLAETAQTVRQIAAACGFVSLTHFQRQFQRHQQRLSRGCAAVGGRMESSLSPEKGLI